MHSETSTLGVLVQDKTITQIDILKICKERENDKNAIHYSFEEAYQLGLNYIPKI
ncbi:MAG: hypothetical protein Q9M94_01070 [Candidatus Gracilibacteria bacterium]|nr:hypothetical protein [Candidatus Gracilibacteria bacterium]MDQ7022460.1 hypothetical protein [Candidatus Gracilibacteria bacterium]